MTPEKLHRRYNYSWAQSIPTGTGEWKRQIKKKPGREAVELFEWLNDRRHGGKLFALSGSNTRSSQLQKRKRVIKLYLPSQTGLGKLCRKKIEHGNLHSLRGRSLCSMTTCTHVRRIALFNLYVWKWLKMLSTRWQSHVHLLHLKNPLISNVTLHGHQINFLTVYIIQQQADSDQIAGLDILLSPL